MNFPIASGGEIHHYLSLNHFRQKKVCYNVVQVNDSISLVVSYLHFSEYFVSG